MTYLRTCAANENSDQPAHSSSLIRIFTGCILDSRRCKVSSREQRRLWSDCADAQADLSLRWANMSESTFSHLYAQFNSNKTFRIISCNVRNCTLCALRPAQTHQPACLLCEGPKTRGFFWRKMKTLIRLRGFTLWSESLLGLYFMRCIFWRFDLTLKGSIFLKNRHFIIQERFHKLIYGNTIIKCGIWQPVKFQLVSRSWTDLKWNDFFIVSLN